MSNILLLLISGLLYAQTNSINNTLNTNQIIERITNTKTNTSITNAQTEEIRETSEESEIFLEGIKKLKEGDIEGAIGKLESIYNENIANPDYFVYLGYLYFIQGNYPRAIKMLQHSLILDNNILVSYLILSEIYYEQHDIVKARQGFERVLSINPDVKLAHIRLYELYKDNNPAKANQHYIRIFQIRSQPIEQFLPGIEKIGKLNLSFKRTLRPVIVISSNQLKEDIFNKLLETDTGNSNENVILQVRNKGKGFKFRLNFIKSPFKEIDKKKFWVKFFEGIFTGIFLIIYQIIQKHKEKKYAGRVVSRYRITKR